jgi:hypothetical protein
MSEKERGRVGSWKSQSANIGLNCLPWQPTLAARLLENGAIIEPYTIIIMVDTLYAFVVDFSSEATRRVTAAC